MMYTRICPQCGRAFHATEEIFNIVYYGQCLECAIDSARWESEGGTGEWSN